MKIIHLSKLEDVFFEENSDLIEALHTGSGGDMAAEKTRGYGVVTVRIENGMLFGIPLRSHITHRSAFITKGTKGLDYTKALLIKDENHVSRQTFEIPKDEFLRIAERELFIREKFEKFVKKYIRAARSGDANILREYRFSTLQNYHAGFRIGPFRT
jgi:protein AbiQ